MSIARDLGRFTALQREQRRALLRAITELAWARLHIIHTPPERLFAPVVEESSRNAEHSGSDIVERVAFAIPRAAARLPFRSDCLVQALAARHWLAAEGVNATLHLGARKAQGAGIPDAHAWLSVGERVVVGGETEAYAPFTPSRAP